MFDAYKKAQFDKIRGEFFAKVDKELLQIAEQGFSFYAPTLTIHDMPYRQELFTRMASEGWELVGWSVGQYQVMSIYGYPVFEKKIKQ